MGTPEIQKIIKFSLQAELVKIRVFDQNSRFDPQKNPDCIRFGSSLNFFLKIQSKLRLKLLSKLGHAFNSENYFFLVTRRIGQNSCFFYQNFKFDPQKNLNLLVLLLRLIFSLKFDQNHV